MRVLTLASAAMLAALTIAPAAEAGPKTSAQTSAKASAHSTAKTQARTPATESVTSAQVQADTTVDAAEIVVPGRARPPGQPISPLPAPGVTARGAISGGVGVNVAPPPSSNRQPTAAAF